jgi:two-component system, chemotaxis family, sensor kinase CheA
MEQFKQKFIEEATDLIQDLEKSSLELSNDYENVGHIEVIFRAMHSLKGGSAMFGFDKIDAFTHHLESAYDQIRKGKRKVNDKLLDITFKSIDHIKVLLGEDDNLSDKTLQNHELLLKSISAMVNDDSATGNRNRTEDESPAERSDKSTYYIQFIPKPNIFENGTNPLLIINELVTLGESRVFPFTGDIPDFNSIDVLLCYTSWVILLSTDSSEETIRDVFMFVDLDCELIIKKVSNENLLGNSEFIGKVEAAHNNNGRSELDFIESLLYEMKGSSVKNQPDEAVVAGSRVKEQNISSIRVSSDKLDELINLVSELVTRQAGLSLISEKINNKDLLVLAEDIEKISRRLRDNTFGIRLIPIENMVTRFQRLVRELSIDLNKEIIFQTEGTETELDKTMIEGLIDPVMHIIRNSIDHGIEDPETRKKAGKPEKGKILLKAFYSGANVLMEISDDGKGIDPKKLFKQAIKAGFIQEDAVLTEKEQLDLIFLPGFSTAESITKISGRGVGMDVVKRKVEELRGEVAISTELKKGTTITIKLPLTLSIIDGLLVTIDSSYYVIPLASVNRCLEFKHQALVNPVNNLIFINDGHIPFAYLRKEFGIKSTPPEIEQIVVIEYGDTLFGLAVDHIVGEYQAVLKSLGKMYKDMDIISGATILGDGTVALLLDPNKIISKFSYKTEETGKQ